MREKYVRANVKKFKDYLKGNEMLQHYINSYLSLVLWDEEWIMKKSVYKKVVSEWFRLIDQKNSDFLKYLKDNYYIKNNLSASNVLEGYICIKY